MEVQKIILGLLELYGDEGNEVAIPSNKLKFDLLKRKVFCEIGKKVVILNVTFLSTSSLLAYEELERKLTTIIPYEFSLLRTMNLTIKQEDGSEDMIPLDKIDTEESPLLNHEEMIIAEILRSYIKELFNPIIYKKKFTLK